MISLRHALQGLQLVGCKLLVCVNCHEKHQQLCISASYIVLRLGDCLLCRGIACNSHGVLRCMQCGCGVRIESIVETSIMNAG